MNDDTMPLSGEPPEEVPDALRRAAGGETKRVLVPGSSVNGKYTILSVLGKGGMGIVYKAEHKNLGTELAIKTIVPAAADDEELVKRFFREAQAAAELGSHPNIVAVRDFGQDKGINYIAMDLIEGVSLDKLIDEELTVQRTAELMIPVADALYFAHCKGILHRDLKPGNIMVDKQGTPHVTDFGLAKRINTPETHRLTLSGMIVGTPSYMSPEQAQGQELDDRSDVYSLGAILYEMLTSAPPFDAKDPIATVMDVIRNEPVPPHKRNILLKHDKHGKDAETICLKAMEKEVNRRYANANELKQDLERLLLGEPIHARPVSMIEKTKRRVKKNPAAWLGIPTALLIALGIGTPIVVSKINEAERERQRQEQLQKEHTLAEKIDKLYDQARSILTSANVRRNQGDFKEYTLLLDQSENLIEDALKINANNAKLLGAHGTILYAKNDYNAATTILSNAIDAGSTDPHITYLLGLSHAMLIREDADNEKEHMRAAREQFLKLLKSQKSAKDEALFGKGLLEYFEGKFAEAIESLDSALAENKHLAIAYLFRGNSKLALRSFEAAINDYTTNLRYSPGSWQTYAKKGEANFGRGNIQEAIEDFTESINIKESGETYHNRGFSYMQLGSAQYDRALKDFNKAILLTPRHEFYISRGALKRRLNDLEGAISDYSESLTIKPTAIAHYNLGNCYASQNNIEEARSMYESAIELNPALGQPYTKLAGIHMTTGNKEKAISVLEDGLLKVKGSFKQKIEEFLRKIK